MVIHQDASEPPVEGPHADRQVAIDASQRIQAVIFDMDGVVTQTASVHSLAWKRMFDEYLLARSKALGVDFVEFDHPREYLSYVDGRPRYEGVRIFLESRGIELPMGAASDAASGDSVCGLGNRKNELFNEIIEAEGVALYDSTIGLIHQLRQRGIRVGLATSSRNSALILSKTGIEGLFETVVDGIVSEKLRLKGKPASDIFTIAAFSLGVDPARAVVVEDAVSGVRAGASGGFALTVGIAREGNEVELREAGADLVVKDLAETHLERLIQIVTERT